MNTSIAGVLLNLENDSEGRKVWQKRAMRLRQDTLSFYNGDNKVGEMSLSQCEVNNVLHMCYYKTKTIIFAIA